MPDLARVVDAQDSEDYVARMRAERMALAMEGYDPYQVLGKNPGGYGHRAVFGLRPMYGDAGRGGEHGNGANGW